MLVFQEGEKPDNRNKPSEQGEPTRNSTHIWHRAAGAGVEHTTSPTQGWFLRLIYFLTTILIYAELLHGNQQL